MEQCCVCGREARGIGRYATQYLFCSVKCSERDPVEWSKAEQNIVAKIANEVDLGDDTREIVAFILSRWFELAQEEAGSWKVLRPQ